MVPVKSSTWSVARHLCYLWVQIHPPWGCREGLGNTWGSLCSLGVPRGISTGGVGCTVWLMAGTGTSRQNVTIGCSVNVFKMKKGRLNPSYWYEGKIKWLSVGTERQTAQPDLPSLSLPCSRKRCSVGLGWFCFAWLFPSGCIFFALPGCWNVPWPRRQQGTESLPFPPWQITPRW